MGMLGKCHSKETKEKMRIAHLGKSSGMLGKKHLDQTKEKMSLSQTGHKGYMLGKKHSEDTKNKISISNKGKHNFWLGKVLSIEHSRKIGEAHIGGVSGMLGKKHSKEWKEAMSQRLKGNQINKGRKMPDEQKQKISEGQLGDKHWNWKGGVTSKNILERTKFSKTVAKQVLKRDSYTCQICETRDGNLQIDHIKSWAGYEKLRFSIDNCRTLCMECHYKTTFGREIPVYVKKWGRKERTIAC